MRSLMIKSCLVYVFLLYSLAYCVSVLAANNDIYLTQAGGGSTALTLSIDQIGSSTLANWPLNIKKYLEKEISISRFS